MLYNEDDGLSVELFANKEASNPVLDCDNSSDIYGCWEILLKLSNYHPSTKS